MKDLQDFTVLRYCCMFYNCQKEYTTKINLKRHVLISHIDKQKFTCERCAKTFASKQNLIEHSYLHSGEKPYECVHCSQKFRHFSSLSLHCKVHRDGQKAPKQCEARFLDRETQTI